MNLKKLGLLGLFCMCILYLNTTCDAKTEEEYSEIIGNFKFTYQELTSNEIWVTKIDIMGVKNVSILKIPLKINGKKVVKLGSKYDPEDDFVETHNIFGIYRSEDDEIIRPKKIINKVAYIKQIILPSTVTAITPNCFRLVQDGKCINIPSRFTKNISYLCEIKWKKFSISSKNKKYKVKNGVLLSKDGKFAYGSVVPMKKLNIPQGVKTIKDRSIFYGSGATDFYIPASVNKIGFQSLFFSDVVRFHVSKKNKHYAETKDCVYSKKSGRLVAASVKNTTFTVPEKVTYLSKTNFAGKPVKKFIIPATVKKIESFWSPYLENITYEFKGKKPPKIEDSFAFKGIKLQVPKGCKKAYRRAVKATSNEYGVKIEISEV